MKITFDQNYIKNFNIPLLIFYYLFYFKLDSLHTYELVFTLSCVYRSLNIVDEITTFSFLPPTIFNSIFLVRTVATIGEYYMFLYLCEFYISFCPMYFFVLAETMCWLSCIYNNYKFTIIEFSIWNIITIVLLYNSKLKFDNIKNLTMICPLVLLLVFNSFHEIFSYISLDAKKIIQSNNVNLGDISIFKSYHLKNKDYWDTRFNYNFVYFIGIPFLFILRNTLIE
jgi:hypothetical protein